MAELIIDKKNCVGCSACEAVCPVQAITMEQNERGFRYPAVDETKCIHCGQCRKVCLCEMPEVLSGKRLEEARYYIAAHSDPQHHRKSQSGAVSFALGSFMIQCGGVVYGCVFNDDNKAVHMRIDTIEDLDKTRRSKYVQSDMQDAFPQVLRDLQAGKSVLFTGTSCQIEGLYLYLDNRNCDMERLYTADLICHGVPSPKVLSDYISYLEEKHHSKVTNVDLRPRKFAPLHKALFQLQNGEEVVDQWYVELFYSNMILRESCGQCKFAKRNKPADITMSDVFGVNEKYRARMDNKMLPSLLMVHSEKGKWMLENSELNIQEILPTDFNQGNICRPSEISPQKEKFWRDYQKRGFVYVLKKYTGAGGIRSKLRRKILRAVHRW